MIGNDNKICSIICGAPNNGLQKELVQGCVIAADRGLDVALAAGITPDLVVGDFDSAESEVPSGVECVRVSPVKDDTDAMLAADFALKRGCKRLLFFCALGGRIDHTIANIQMLYHLKMRGVEGVLFGDDARLFLLSDESAEIPRYDGYLSVFAYDKAAVVTESGVKYPVTKHPLTNDMPIGVSNEITAEKAVVTVHSGTALVLEVHAK
ncbi:MAG: thiamine diphosphokinase [Lachnospiraceae bacterium]|nr:thiamine diphosphokinase [Ruminococcus sp.]MCM1273884.1 thiamine diphosphokinase [Lachnospiraceae bacterium]